MENKQTAVDYLIKEFSHIIGDIKKISTSNTILLISAIEEAKKMEKEQIMDAYRFPNTFLNQSSEDYYNKTYGKAQ